MTDDTSNIEATNQASEERDRTSARRDRSSEARDRMAAGLDRSSEGADRDAGKRDRDAEQRDRAAERRDGLTDRLEAGSLPGARVHERRSEGSGRRRSDVRAGSDRASARMDRAGSALDRANAASDREAAGASREKGARDRIDASDDREAASVDRDASARAREVSSIDELTGAYRRGTGLVELEREMKRARRTDRSFVLVFIDVDGLKTINDSLGHDAGDQLLCRVVDTVRDHLRSYDPIVRLGGDEFLCGLSDLDLNEAIERFHRIDADLATHGTSITVGLAQGKSGTESLVQLVALADAALYQERDRVRDA